LGSNQVIGELLVLTHKMLGHFALVITGAGLFTAVDFNHTITLGSVLIGIIVIVVAALFTIRSKIATIWREEAEGERAAKERAESELAEEKASRAAFELEQQEIRHNLKNDLAACQAQLKIMEARTDLTAALEAIRQMNQQTVTEISAAIAQIFVDKSAQEHAKTHSLLGEIRDRLPSEQEEAL
jgi:hypothetical protein